MLIPHPVEFAREWWSLWWTPAMGRRLAGAVALLVLLAAVLRRSRGRPRPH